MYVLLEKHLPKSGICYSDNGKKQSLLTSLVLSLFLGPFKQGIHVIRTSWIMSEFNLPDQSRLAKPFA
jgi:hypothetical protein